MAGFTKLFSDIVDSSIWEEDPAICKVWVTLLALADESGFVRGSVGWLAAKAKVPQEICTQAIHTFESVDTKSRTTDHEGRRIRAVERGWLILNHGYFRNEHGQLSNDPRKVYKREWMRKKRSSALSTSCPQKSTSVHTASVSVSVQGTGVPEGVQGETDPIAEVSARLCKMFKRRTGIRAYNEQYALAEVCRRHGVLQELDELERWRPTTQYFPRTLPGLLENWDKTLDASRNQPEPSASSNGNVAAMIQSQEYNRVVEKIDRLRSFASVDAVGQRFFTEAQQSEITQLKKRRDELKKQLGIQV